MAGSWDSTYQIDVSLGDVYSYRHSHPTLPRRHEDIMCSSQALIWQGFSISEGKDVTAVWGGTRCKRGIIQLQRQGSALSLPSSSFAIYLSGYPQCALCFTGCRHHCASDKRSRWKPVHARNETNTQAASKVRARFRKMLHISESWHCTCWWETSPPVWQVFERRRSKGETWKRF